MLYCKVHINEMNLQFLIIQRLLYFDVFKHPLKRSELAHFLPAKIKASEIQPVIDSLSDKKCIQINEGDFINVDDDLSKNSNRNKYNEQATKMLDLALDRGKFISRFPFIEAVFISGSLSKGVLQEDGDIDFFMVTKERRLWLARACLVLYKRIFLFNSRKEFCINYFKSADQLKIEDENLFTAIELGTILPVVGKSTFLEIVERNNWIKSYVSGFINLNFPMQEKRKASLISKWIEIMLGSRLGNALDKKILDYTIKRNRSKYKHLASSENYDQMFRSNQSTAKVHPNDHQQKVLTMLKQKEDAFYKEKNLKEFVHE